MVRTMFVPVSPSGRENVEQVDGLLIGTQPGQPRFDHFLEDLPVNWRGLKTVEPRLDIGSY